MKRVLTTEEKKRLGYLEPKLRAAAKYGNYGEAKVLAAEVQQILRSAENETRLMQAKNWLFMAALESGNITTAQMGFEGVRKKTAKTTRVYLEATALEAVCYLRKGELNDAEPLMREAVKRVGNIKSAERRKQFYKRLLEIFEQEWVIAVLQQDSPSLRVTDDELQNEAGELLRSRTEEDIERYACSDIPPSRLASIFDAYDCAYGFLPSAERKRLPNPETRKSDLEKGRTIISSVKKVLWRSICDENSAVYKMWFEHGVMAVLDKKLISAAVIASLAQMKIGYYALAVSVTAILLKTGVEVFCDRFEPLDLMIEKADKR